MPLPTDEEIDKLQAAGQITPAQAQKMRERRDEFISTNRARTRWGGKPMDPPEDLSKPPDPNFVVKNSLIQVPKLFPAPAPPKTDEEAMKADGVQPLNQPEMEAKADPGLAVKAPVGGGGGVGASPVSSLQKNLRADYEKVRAARDQYAGAVASEFEVAAEKAKEIAGMYQNQANDLDQIEKQRQAAELDRQARVKESYDKYNQAAEEYKNAKVDPDNYWKTRSTGQKVLAGIAIVLGGFGAGATAIGSKGRGDVSNAGLDAINAGINRDIQLQKLEIDKKGNYTEMRRNLYSDMRQMVGDERAAELLTRKILLENTAAKIEAKAASYGSKEIQARAQVAAAKLREDGYQADMEFRARVDSMSLGGGSGGGGSLFGKSGLPDDSTLVVMPDGTMVKASKDSEAIALREAIGGDAQFKDTISQAEEIRRSNPKTWFVPGTSAYERLKALKEVAVGAYMKATGQKSDSDKKSAEIAVGNWTNYNPIAGGDELDKARALATNARVKITAQVKAGGFQQVQTVTDPRTGKRYMAPAPEAPPPPSTLKKQ